MYFRCSVRCTLIEDSVTKMFSMKSAAFVLSLRSMSSTGTRQRIFWRDCRRVCARELSSFWKSQRKKLGSVGGDGRKEDCSQLVVSGGEELREMALSSLDRMEVDDEEEVVSGAERSAELSPLTENETEFENPLLRRVSMSSMQVLPSEEEEAAFPDPLLEGIVTTTTTSPPLSPVDENCSFENPLLGRFSSASSSSLQVSSSHISETPFHNPLLEDIASATSATPTITEIAGATTNTATANTDGDREYDSASAPCPGFISYDPEIIEYYTPSSPVIAPSSSIVPQEIIESSLATSTTTTTTISPPFLQRVLNLVAEELATIDFFASTAEEAIATGSTAVSSSTSNDDTTSATAAVKTVAVEEPDWESVHQQGEELHMQPYQRRFENRPLETRVFLLDPDRENRSLGEDEEIGREIEVKREPVSEDEETMGVDWSLAHEINRLDLEERESSEVPEEIKAQGACVTIDKGGSSISSDSSSENSLLAALEEDDDDEEYEEERQKKNRGKSSKKIEEEEKEEEDKSSEVAAEVSFPSSDKSDSSILSEGRLALKNLTADSSESGNDDREPSASGAARLAARPKRALRTLTRTAATVTQTTTTTTTTTVSPLEPDQNYTNTSPTTIISTASPPLPAVSSTSSTIIEGEEETPVDTPQNIEVPETSARSKEPRSEQEIFPLQWMLYQEPFKNARRRLDSSRIRRTFTVGKFFLRHDLISNKQRARFAHFPRTFPL